ANPLCVPYSGRGAGQSLLLQAQGPASYQTDQTDRTDHGEGRRPGARRTCDSRRLIVMRVVHLLRKCNPAEWGGTETAVQRLMEGLRQHEVASVVYCPHVKNGRGKDLLADAGWTVRRFRAVVPVWGVSEKYQRQFVAVGGNLMSFDLPLALWREPEVDVIHSHTLGRLGAVALNVARFRRLPFVV